MITFNEQTFIDSCPQWQALYAKGLAWCTSGLTGLTSSGVAPFHQPTSLSKRNDKRQVVYAVFNDASESEAPEFCFFEDDYVEGFARFKSKPSARLYVSFLPMNGNMPMEIWLNNEDYIDAHHGNCMAWYQQTKSWGI